MDFKFSVRNVKIDLDIKFLQISEILKRWFKNIGAKIGAWRENIEKIVKILN